MSRIGVLLATLAFLVAEDWRRIEPGLALHFPRDHASHAEFRTEWWYSTGHLEDEEGRDYGFQLTIFRRGVAAAGTGSSLQTAPLHVFAGHLALAELATGRFRYAERLRRAGPLARASEQRLEIALEDWSLELDGERTLSFAATDPAVGIGLQLALVPRKELVAHGQDGYSRKGDEPGDASAYLSWTRLDASGTVLVDGESRRVHGEAWFDHEWGSSQLGQGIVGWDWFAVQLDDGREVMLYGLRREDGTPSPRSAGSLVSVDGSTTALGHDDFAIEVTRRWTSPRTHAAYPSGWRISIPDERIDLVLTPALSDCELVTGASTGVVYWEGPVLVTGTAGGRGYAELVGYAGSVAGRF